MLNFSINFHQFPVGHLYNIFNRQLIYAGCFVLMGTAYFLTPHVRLLAFFIFAQGMTGIAAAGMDAAATIWPLELFKDRVNPYLQAIHFAFALGNTFAPLISAPFLSPTVTLDLNSTLAFDLRPASQSLLFVPYTIAAVILFVAAIFLVILNYLRPYQVPESIQLQDDMVQSICVEYVANYKGQSSTRQLLTSNVVDRLRLADSLYLGSGSFNFSGRTKSMTQEREALLKVKGQPMKNNKDLPPWLSRLIIGLGAVLLCGYCGIEMNAMNYLEMFVVKGPLKLSKEKGAHMTSVMAGAFTIGRGASVYLATKVTPVTMLYFDVIFMMLGTLIILIFGHISEAYIWLGIIVLGLGFASVYPTTYAFLEPRVHLDNTCTGIMLFVSSLIPAVNPIIVGSFVHIYPMVFMWLNLFSATCCFLAFVGLHATDRLRQKYLTS